MGSGSHPSSLSVRIFKVTTLIVGLVALVIGCFSHFESTWAKEECEGFTCIKVYEICQFIQKKSCPAIELEYYYVAMIIICFFLSLTGLVLTSLIDTSSNSFNIIDAGYHGLSAILLATAGILYIISAEKINDIVIANKGPDFNFRRPEKLAAGAVTILQAILYAITGMFVARARGNVILV